VSRPGDGEGADDFYVKRESALLIMVPVKIIIPVSDYAKVERYYTDVLQFELHEDLFFVPNGAPNVALKLLIVDAASREASPPRRHFPIFSFLIDSNFASYCDKLMSRGAVFESVISHPGGYYALLSDPEGNQFEIECENFDEVNAGLDPFSWPFYKRY
jgi:catechol 2,3-dioxygenase-like lactoylglutathione lyase family enzyme